MTKVSIDQKRLETLRRQLYGKGRETTQPTKQTEKFAEIKNSPLPIFPQQNQTDARLLKKDLLKIFSLSILALFIQLLLYFGLEQNNFLNFF